MTAVLWQFTETLERDGKTLKRFVFIAEGDQ